MFNYLPKIIFVTHLNVDFRLKSFRFLSYPYFKDG